jgi:hypothetical protein
VLQRGRRPNPVKRFFGAADEVSRYGRLLACAVQGFAPWAVAQIRQSFSRNCRCFRNAAFVKPCVVLSLNHTRVRDKVFL